MKLSLSKYAWLCVLGAEIVYIGCLIYGSFLSGAPSEFHRAVFSTLPLGSSGGFVSFIGGFITIGVLSFIGGSYIAWMHNASLER